jgi:hypothetical protein
MAELSGAPDDHWDIRLATINRPISFPPAAISATLGTGLSFDEIRGDVCKRRNCAALFRVFVCYC